jgi:hypothetical protein
LIHKFVVSRSFKIRFCLDILDYRPFGLLTLRTNELTRVISVSNRVVAFDRIFFRTCEVWDNCSQTDNDRLEKLQLEAARIVEDTKGAIRNRISKKNRQHNGQKKKYKWTNNDRQNIHIKLKIE